MVWVQGDFNNFSGTVPTIAAAKLSEISSYRRPASILADKMTRLLGYQKTLIQSQSAQSGKHLEIGAFFRSKMEDISKVKKMAYNNFSLQDAISQFDLNLIEATFCESLPTAAPNPGFINIFEQYLPLAQRAKSEKAKSELLISPILVELLQLSNNQIRLFSGEEFNVDRERGLNGFCDFLLARSTLSSIIQAPIVMLVEAKKGELDVGLGQCTAEMVAAQIFNANEEKIIPVVYGCVTSGKVWQFLKLENYDLTLDLNEYTVTPVERILGILKWMVSQ